MNRSASLTFAFGIAVALLQGCGGGMGGGQETAGDFASADQALDPLDPKVCAQYESYTGALGEATIACTGTIGPQSFHADSDDGPLLRDFDQCTARGSSRLSLLDVDDLLILQTKRYEKDLPGLRRCFAKGWRDWLAQNGKLLCPTWTKVEWSRALPPDQIAQYTDIPTAPLAAQFRKDIFPKLPLEQARTEPPKDLHQPKANFLYSVRIGTRVIDRACQTPEDCAQRCAGGLAGFYVRDLTIKEQPFVVGDPLWWLDPTEYAAGTNPYLAADYYHPMSFYKALPGARYGHRNREGEACSYYLDPYHMLGKLTKDCTDPLDPSSCHMTHCDP